jgi:hypothetical protein
MKRPTGIWILAALYGVGSIFLIATQLAMARHMADGFEELGFSVLGAHLSIAFLGILGLTAAVGMWRGKRWGWWLGAFYMAYSVTRNLNALVTIPMIVQQFDVPASGVAKYYVKFGGRVIIHSLVCWYFFSPRVESYFEMETSSKIRRLLILVSSAIVVTVALGLLNSVAR